MKKLAYIFAFMMLAVSAYSQAWSGILDPSRATDWTQAGIPGGIPNRITVCATVNPSGKTDSTDRTAINSAIWGCPANEVVQLAAGTFTVNGILVWNSNGAVNLSGAGTISNVTLRGMGPDQTIIKMTGGGACTSGHDAICMAGSEANPINYAGSTTWTGGYSKGSTSITVGSTAGISVGQIIALDQRDDSIGICPASGGTGDCTGVAGATESGTTAMITTSLPHGFSVNQCVPVGGVSVAGYNGWWTVASVPTSTTFTYTAGCGAYAGTNLNSGLASSGGGSVTLDTGGVITANTTTPGVIDESAGQMRLCPDAADPQCATGEISQRNQTEWHHVDAVNSGTNTLTIDPPLIMPNWRSSQAPGVYWTTTNYGVRNSIESLTVDLTNYGGSSSNGGIIFLNCYQCWAKNVRTINGARNHYWILQSLQTEIEDSYLFGSPGAIKSYGVESFGSTGDLIQNNICQHVVACDMTGTDNGYVKAYNFSIDSGYSPTDWLIGMTFENHDFSAYGLFEGLDTDAINLDNVHGTGSANTLFRSRSRGADTPAKTQPNLAVMENAYNRAENFVGNIIGTQGDQTGYSTTGCTEPCYITSFPRNYVWALDMQAELLGVPNDPVVTASLLRWGNWDVVHNTAQWNTSEIPTSGVAYVNGNSIPATHILPASFYLPAQPPWWSTPWGTPAWPAIGPDVTSGVAPDSPNAMQDAIPAQICWLMTPIDPAYQQTMTVTGASWSSGTATLTASNTLLADNTIQVVGMNPSGYNGTFEVTASTSTTVSYALPSNPGTFVSGGSIGWPDIRLFNASKCYASYGAFSTFSGFGGNTY